MLYNNKEEQQGARVSRLYFHQKYHRYYDEALRDIILLIG